MVSKRVLEQPVTAATSPTYVHTPPHTHTLKHSLEAKRNAGIPTHSAAGCVGGWAWHATWSLCYVGM
jgi:hypothetical protein